MLLLELRNWTIGKKKSKILEMYKFKRPTGQLIRMQGKIRKMVTEAKNKSREKTCSTAESYLGGKRSTEAWRIL
jgi:hypothetical protein